MLRAYYTFSRFWIFHKYIQIHGLLIIKRRLRDGILYKFRVVQNCFVFKNTWNEIKIGKSQQWIYGLPATVTTRWHEAFNAGFDFIYAPPSIYRNKARKLRRRWARDICRIYAMYQCAFHARHASMVAHIFFTSSYPLRKPLSYGTGLYVKALVK